MQTSTARLTNSRTSRAPAVRTHYFDGEKERPNEIGLRKDSPRRERPKAEFNKDVLLQEGPEPTPRSAPLRIVEDSVSGHLQSFPWFGEQGILATHADEERSKLLGWVQGVSVHEFIDVDATGVFRGRKYNGAEITLPNSAPM